MIIVLMIFFFVAIFVIVEITLRNERKPYNKYINKEKNERRCNDAETTSKSN